MAYLRMDPKDRDETPDAGGPGQQVDTGKSKRRIKNKVYSRIVGYYSATDDWNQGKLQEFEDRNPYLVAGRVVGEGGQG